MAAQRYADCLLHPNGQRDPMDYIKNVHLRHRIVEVEDISPHHDANSAADRHTLDRLVDGSTGARSIIMGS